MMSIVHNDYKIFCTYLRRISKIKVCEKNTLKHIPYLKTDIQQTGSYKNRNCIIISRYGPLSE